MYEMVIPLRWDSLDGLLAFLDDTLCRCGQSADRRVRLSVLVEELFSIAIASGSTGTICCRIQLPNRMVLRFGGGQTPADLTYCLSLWRRIASAGMQNTPGLNSWLIQWD